MHHCPSILLMKRRAEQVASLGSAAQGRAEPSDIEAAYLLSLQLTAAPGKAPTLAECNDAARRGYREALRWLCQRGGPVDATTLWAAAKSGNIGILEDLRTGGCPWNEDAPAGAAKHGRLLAVQWLRAGGCPWDRRTGFIAAKKGHLDVLRWAHRAGLPLVAETCAWAADGGRLDVVQWLRSVDCPWNSEVVRAAREGGHVELERWAIENGCPSDNVDEHTRFVATHVITLVSRDWSSWDSDANDSAPELAPDDDDDDADVP